MNEQDLIQKQQEIERKEQDLERRVKEHDEREKEANAVNEAMNKKVDIINMLARRGLDDEKSLAEALDKHVQNAQVEQKIPSTSSNEDGNDMEKWKTSIEDVLNQIINTVNVERLRTRVKDEIASDPKGLEYVEKGISDNLLHNLSMKLSQKGNKGLRGELGDMNQNFINYYKRFDGLNQKPIEPKKIKNFNSTPEQNEKEKDVAPVESKTLPSHGTGNNEKSKKFSFDVNKEGFDMDKSDEEYDKLHPLSSFAEKTSE